MSFDSDCRSGANPLRGQSRHEIVDIYMTFDLRQLSFIIISIAIHPRHRHRHHHCRHHHQHHHFSRVLSSRLLPPAFIHATLSSSVFICFYPCASAISFFEAKLVLLQSLRSVIRTCLHTLQYSDSMFLEPCLGNCSWTRCLTLVYRNLAWEPVLGSLAWEPVLGSLLLGTCSWEHCLVTGYWELSLGNPFLETLPACFKPVHWDLAREPVFRIFAWEPCLGSCPSEPCLGFCSCFQPCLQMCFEISLCKLFLESCSWEHEQPETMLGNVFVGTVLATYCSEPS